MKDYYKILEVHFNARKEIIQSAYRTLVKIYHPDNFNGDEEIIREINEAYELLTDDIRRKIYDEEYIKIYDKQNKISYNRDFLLAQKERELILKENELKRKEKELLNKEKALHDKIEKNKKIDEIKKNLELKEKIKALGDLDLKENKKLNILKDIIREGEKVIPLLKEIFENANDSMRFYIIQAIAEIGVKDELIVKALKDKYAPVRAEACHAIGMLKIKGTGYYLIPLLMDEEQSVRKEAIYAITQLQLHSARSIIKEIIANKKEPNDLKIEAIKSLGVIGNSEDIEILTPLLKNKNREIKEIVEKTIFILKLNQNIIFEDNEKIENKLDN